MSRWIDSRGFLYLGLKDKLEFGSPEETAFRAKLLDAVKGEVASQDLDPPVESTIPGEDLVGNPIPRSSEHGHGEVQSYVDYYFMQINHEPTLNNSPAFEGATWPSLTPTNMNDLCVAVKDRCPELEVCGPFVQAPLEGEEPVNMGIGDGLTLLGEFGVSKLTGPKQVTAPDYTYLAASSAGKLTVTNLAPGEASGIELTAHIQDQIKAFGGGYTFPFSSVLVHDFTPQAGWDTADLVIEYGIKGIYELHLDVKNQTLDIFNFMRGTSEQIDAADGLGFTLGRWDNLFELGTPFRERANRFGGSIAAPSWTQGLQNVVKGDGDKGVFSSIRTPSPEFKRNSEGELKAAIVLPNITSAKSFINVRNVGTTNQSGTLHVHDFSYKLNDKRHQYFWVARNNGLIVRNP